MNRGPTQPRLYPIVHRYAILHILLVHRIYAETNAKYRAKMRRLMNHLLPKTYASLHNMYVYFLLFNVFTTISSNPAFASLSGNTDIAEIALLPYSSANARVCSKPSLWRTNSRAYRMLVPNQIIKAHISLPS